MGFQRHHFFRKKMHCDCLVTFCYWERLAHHVGQAKKLAHVYLREWGWHIFLGGTQHLHLPSPNFVSTQNILIVCRNRKIWQSLKCWVHLRPQTVSLCPAHKDCFSMTAEPTHATLDTFLEIILSTVSFPSHLNHVYSLSAALCISENLSFYPAHFGSWITMF